MEGLIEGHHGQGLLIRITRDKAQSIVLTYLDGTDANTALHRPRMSFDEYKAVPPDLPLQCKSRPRHQVGIHRCRVPTPKIDPVVHELILAILLPELSLGRPPANLEDTVAVLRIMRHVTERCEPEVSLRPAREFGGEDCGYPVLAPLDDLPCVAAYVFER